MRIPEDREKWTLAHAEEAHRRAMKTFAQYEQRVNFDGPRDKLDELRRPYRLARQLALDTAYAVGVREVIKRAEELP